MSQTDAELREQQLIDEYVNRWYLSEDGDSEALKQSSKAEMRRQLVAILKTRDAAKELEARIDEAQKIYSYYIPTGTPVAKSVRQRIKKYKQQLAELRRESDLSGSKSALD